jgi:hypothetical protein
MTDWIAEAKVELADPESTLWKCNVIEGLLAEIERLREEIEQLNGIITNYADACAEWDRS